jgi:hypothetical protein
MEERMTTRISLTKAELDARYSAAPFTYDFAQLFSWGRPFTLPITPPDLEALSISMIVRNAESIAQDVIEKIEATLPIGTPGLARHLNENYVTIEQSHSDNISILNAKKQFLLDVQDKIQKKENNYHTQDLKGQHIYINEWPTPAEHFAINTSVHGIPEEFYVIQQQLHNLMRSMTGAQIEIIHGRCLRTIHQEIRKINAELAALSPVNLPSNHQINTITLTTDRSIQIASNSGTIAIDSSYWRLFERTLLAGLKLLEGLGEAIASRIFKVGIGALVYTPTLGNSDLYEDSALSIPAELLNSSLPENLYDAALRHSALESPYRIHAENDTFTLLKNPHAPSIENRIPLRPFFLDDRTNHFISIPSEDFPIKLSLPIHTPNGSSTGTPNKPIPTYPYRGVTLTPLHIEATPLPALEAKDFKDCIYCFPPESGLPPLYIVFNSPYPGATTVGTFSGRPYNPEKAGGPIERLDWRDATFSRAGIDLVKLHISRFEPSDANNIMIDRLEKILQGESQATDTDKRFYTHEIRELERFRALGLPDKIRPEDRGEAWNNTHTATLEDYQLTSAFELLYTPEAIEADDQQTARENK